jgi:DNA-binding SARP family transcriptional activator
MTGTTLRVLGRIAVAGPDGERVQAGHAGAVLALLAMECGRTVSFDRIVEQLWGGEPPPSVRSTVYANVSRLRSVLKDTAFTIESRAPGYVLAGPREEVDAHAVADCVCRADDLASREDWPAVLAVTQVVRELWAGTPFAGLEVREDLENDAHRLERLAERAEELSALALLHTDRTDEAARAAEALVRRDVFNEAYWRLRMRAEHADGRTAAALATYTEFRDLLNDELGIDPSEQLRALHQQVLRDAEDTAHDQRALPAPAPVRVWEVVPPVGRDRERRVLDEALAHALTRSGRLVLIDGEPGIGKTRLAEYVAGTAAQAGARVAWSRASAGPGTPALWLWEQLLRELRAGHGPSPQALDPGTDHELAPEQARFRGYERIAAEVLAASATQPLVVVLDDLQWADEGSLQTLVLLSKHLRGRRCLIVATARPRATREADPTAELSRDQHVVRLRLAPLTRAEVDALVEAWDGELDADAEGTDALWERTGGNAYLLTELLRDGATGRVPSTIGEVFDRRLAEVAPEVRDILEHFAVAGRRIDPLVIARARRTTVAEVVRALEPLRAEGLVRSDPATRSLGFVHDLTREAIAERIPAAEVIEVHARLAAAISEVYAEELEPHLDQLADHRHHASGGAPSLSVYEACMAAADAAAARHAYDRAALHRRRALRALLPGHEHRDLRFEVLFELTTELRLAGDVVGAGAALSQAIAVARSLDDQVLLRRVLAVLGEVSMWNWRHVGEVDHEAVAALEDVLERDDVASRAGAVSDAERARLVGTLAVELYYGDERERSEALAREGVRLARRTEDSVLLGRTLNNFVIASWFTDRDDVRLAALDETMTLVDHGLPQVNEAVARLQRAPLLLQRGDVAGFVEDLTRAEWLAPRLGRLELEAQVASQWMGFHALRGDLVAAREALVRMDRMLTRTSIWGADWIRLMGELTTARIEGSLPELVSRLLRAATPDEGRMLRLSAVLALAVTGDRDQATDLRARWGLTAWPARSYWGSAFEWVQAAELELLLGGPGRRAAYERIGRLDAPLVLIGTALGVWGPADLLRSRLAAALGDTERAAEHAASVNELSARLHASLGAAPAWPLSRTPAAP